ncbi:MAG: hypothetical protein Rhob2KO_24230 [Rhodopirellula baltica]
MNQESMDVPFVAIHADRPLEHRSSDWVCGANEPGIGAESPVIIGGHRKFRRSEAACGIGP